MTATKRWTARALVLFVLLLLCGAPELAQAQSQTQNPPPPDAAGTNTAEAASPPAQAPESSQDNGIVDPSRAPLQPVPAPAPNAAGPRNGTAAQSETAPPPAQKKPEQPAGAAVGQRGPVAGGAASKPAGNAIAPAKQRQARSLLIKAGLIGAAAIAIGTVAALSKGSPSKPPGAR